MGQMEESHMSVTRNNVRGWGRRGTVGPGQQKRRLSEIPNAGECTRAATLNVGKFYLAATTVPVVVVAPWYPH